MDTMAIYTYLATLKTGCTDSLENFKRYVTQGEIEFRAKFTQFMTEGDGKGANLILSDYMELKETLNGCVKEVGNPYHEQFVYSLKKTKEAIDYIKKIKKFHKKIKEILKNIRSGKHVRHNIPALFLCWFFPFSCTNYKKAKDKNAKRAI